MYHGDAPRNASGRILGRKEAFERFPAVGAAVWDAAHALFPVRITRSWADRIEHARDPLARQVLPDLAELERFADDVADPIGDGRKRPVPWIVQKHPDRALLLVTRRCHLHCRYCFRRDQSGVDPTGPELDRAIGWILASGVEEVILSGGDPLVLPDDRLGSILDRLAPIPVRRIHTRAPITAPERVTGGLVRTLAERRPLWVVLHSNHPNELDDAVARGIGKLRDAGLPLLNQSVLLRGVNDDADVLAALCRRLVRLGVAPYYLHHPDAVAGAGHFRISVDEGLRIHADLARRVSGVALPRYVIDPPDGSGKVDVRAHVAAMDATRAMS
jgi:lysine 2,3-aminomutase